MKRILLVVWGIAMTLVSTLQASPVSVSEARQVADNFFTSATRRISAGGVQPTTRLAYSAREGRYYVFDRGVQGGFVVVAGDDRLPRVLGYGARGDFSSSDLPPAVKYWLGLLDGQIALVQSHGDVAVHHSAKRAAAVGPLLTTQWNQEAPYNNYCPTYGQGVRAVTGCVATATAQVMNYHQWPPVGRGSHSYVCNVNGKEPVELSADFSQSVYRWDLMLDIYDENSSAESCDAVARLMSDVGIAMDMKYGSSSGAYENDALAALERYFGYSDKGYILNRDLFGTDEWDQLLVDEISKNRPVLYVGSAENTSHAFVLDGYDNEGYFHVNWGWGGDYDGFFLVSLLNPGSYDFKYNQRGLFGLVPETQSDAIDDVLYMDGMLVPIFSSAPLGTQTTIEIDLNLQGNMISTDTVQYYDYGDVIYAFDTVQVKLGVYDIDDVECCSQVFTVYYDLSYLTAGMYFLFDVPQSLKDGEYKLKLFYSLDGGVNFDHQIQPAYYYGKELYDRMLVADGTAYFKHRFLSAYYGVDSFVVPGGVRINDGFNIGVNLSYRLPWMPEYEIGPTGNVYLSLLKDGVEVAASPMSEVTVPFNAVNTYQLQLTAPLECGRYDLVLNDESGTHMLNVAYGASSVIDNDFMTVPVYILPPCQGLVEDFEGMKVNNSTSDQNVQGSFTTWSFNKTGVRAPGEGKCNGTNSVMMKTPSTVYTTQPVSHNFIFAQATFFNPTSSAAKYRMDYSLDGGTTWKTAPTVDGLDVVDMPKKSQFVATWHLDLTADEPATFRIAMLGGSGTTYVDDVVLYYTDLLGDVNGDGEVNIADVNCVINVIQTDAENAAADVNGDGEVNIADVNVIISLILNG